jgi:hypothetical protein
VIAESYNQQKNEKTDRVETNFYCHFIERVEIEVVIKKPTNNNFTH